MRQCNLVLDPFAGDETRLCKSFLFYSPLLLLLNCFALVLFSRSRRQMNRNQTPRTILMPPILTIVYAIHAHRTMASIQQLNTCRYFRSDRGIICWRRKLNWVKWHDYSSTIRGDTYSFSVLPFICTVT